MSVGSCQGNWTAPQGVVYSPDFPDEYGPDRNCSWALSPPGAALELTFRLFELADPRDRLELRDAASGSLLSVFDGARPPPPGPLRLRAAGLLLTFRSDARGHAQGFALTYRGESPPGRPPPAAPPLCFTLLSAGLQDAADDPAPKGSAQTPAAPPDWANVSCSPQPGAPEAAMRGEAGVRGGRESGEPPLPDPVLTAPCARSPSLLDGDGHLGAAAAAPVAAASASPTVRPLGQGLRADASVPRAGVGGSCWEAGASKGNGARRKYWVLEGRGLASTQGIVRGIAGEAGCWR